MNYRKSILFSVLLFLFVCPDISLSQINEAKSDSAFKEYFENAWEKITDSNFSDSLQQKYADEFYAYYKQNPDAETGHHAIASAFMMWGNIGAADKFDNAVENLSYDSKIWTSAIVYGSNAYTRDENRTREEYYSWLEILKNKLTHPESKSEVILWLARYYHEKEDTDRVIKLARSLIDINASEFYVNQALGFQQEIENLTIGAKAPDFSTKTIRGKQISLSDFKDQIVLLEFWATWCGPCLPEIPHLKTIDSTYADRDFQLIGISLDSDTTKLNEFIQKEHIDWLQIQQPDQYDDQITNLYNVYVIPRSFIIGHKGTILAKDLRGIELEEEIEKLLEK